MTLSAFAPVFCASPEGFQKVRELLLAEQVVAIPTETVYGLGGSAVSEKALGRIFSAKGRPPSDPLILHVAAPVNSLEALSPWVDLQRLSKFSSVTQEQLARLLKHFWPGPLTLVLPKSSQVPSLVTSGRPTVAIRCPAHSITQQLLQSLPFPLAAPSANQFGHLSPTSVEDVQKELGDKIAGILEGGPCQQGLESTILLPPLEPGLSSFTLLRPGALSKEALEACLQAPLAMPKTPSTPGLVKPALGALAPGLLDSHYAPRKPLFLLSSPALKAKHWPLLWQHPQAQQAGFLIFGTPALQASFEEAWQKQFPSKPLIVCLPYDPQASAQADPLWQAAQGFFKALRSLDEHPEVRCLIAEPSPVRAGVGLALQDRLERAHQAVLSLPLKEASSL